MLFTSMFRDGGGQAFIATQAGQSIAQWANVAVYVMADTILGTGGGGLCGLSGAGHTFTRSFGPRVAAPSGFIGSRKAGHFYHRTR
jgi:hypothetical protein